jgi:RHS repeat-associated protein
MTDSSGNIQVQYSYDSWGKVTKIQGSESSDFQYAGYYLHSPSALGVTLTRLYDAGIGRWINRDRLGERGGLNLYTYAGNKPTQFVDPTGEDCRLWGDDPPPQGYLWGSNPNPPGYLWGSGTGIGDGDGDGGDPPPQLNLVSGSQSLAQCWECCNLQHDRDVDRCRDEYLRKRKPPDPKGYEECIKLAAKRLQRCLEKCVEDHDYCLLENEDPGK